MTARIRVAVLTTDVPGAACPELRLQRPLGACADRIDLSFCVHLEPQGRISVDSDSLARADVVVLQRFFPQAGTAPLLEQLLGGQRPLVYETDDFLLEIPEGNPAHAGSAAVCGWIARTLRAASAVSVSTLGLREALAPWRADAQVLPNLVDRRLFEAPVRARGRTLRIGYVGTATHARDLAVLEPALERLVQLYGERIQLVWFGCHTPRLARLPRSEVIPFDLSYASYASRLRDARLDLVLVPLADNTFNRSKSNIKWLELSAAGVPGVFADLAPYRASVEPGATGLLARAEPEAWLEAIARMLEDEPLRVAIARRAQAEVLARFSLEAGAARFGDFYAELAAARAGAQRPAPPPRCSVVIPVWNRAELTAQCLDALRSLRMATSCEVIVVDNGSTDATSRVLAEREWVRVIRNERNLGFAVACNQGARAARGGYVLFLNNDTLPLAGWLDALVVALDADPGAGIAGPKLLYPDRSVQHAGIAISRDHACPYLIYRGVAEDDPKVNRRRTLHAVTGACLLIRRALFRELGGFDEGYRNSFEDVDLCLRATALGWRVLYEPASVLFHLESQTPGRSDHDRANLERFRARWPDPLWVDEDLRYFEDGVRFERFTRDGAEWLAIHPLEGADAELWARAAEVERLGARAGVDAVRALLDDAELWPASRELRAWAARACSFHGLHEAAARFESRASAARRTERPAPSLHDAITAQLREI